MGKKQGWHTCCFWMDHQAMLCFIFTLGLEEHGSPFVQGVCSVRPG